MPTSHYFQIGDIVSFILFTNPRHILDIGTGFGKYGMLSREYLELWDGREKYQEWTRKIEGIEVFEPYITPIHDAIYDRIYTGDAIDILPTLTGTYDLILLIDILEHFGFEAGLKILKEVMRCGRNVLISIPNYMGTQKAAFQNRFETHRFQWRPHHFREYQEKFVLKNLGGSLIVYLGEDARDVRRKWRVMKWKHSTPVLFVFRLLEGAGFQKQIEQLLNHFTTRF